MDKGIAGFRIDALKHLYESATLEDEPHYPGHENLNGYDDIYHNCTLDQPESIEIIREWRQTIENFKKSRSSSFSR